MNAASGISHDTKDIKNFFQQTSPIALKLSWINLWSNFKNVVIHLLNILQNQ